VRRMSMKRVNGVPPLHFPLGAAPGTASHLPGNINQSQMSLVVGSRDPRRCCGSDGQSRCAYAVFGAIGLVHRRYVTRGIAATARRIVEQGRNILGLNRPTERPSGYDLQTSAPGGSAASNLAQL
jgi:hypothetical protein